MFSEIVKQNTPSPLLLVKRIVLFVDIFDLASPPLVLTWSLIGHEQPCSQALSPLVREAQKKESLRTGLGQEMGKTI